MPVHRSDQFLKEKFPAPNSANPNVDLWISECGELTQFGTFIQELQPGSRSSIKHWHSNEDEMIYVLDGDVTVVEGEEKTTLQQGDAATFAAGRPVGHYLENRSGSTIRYLVVGTRAPIDQITYPDFDRVCHRDRSQPEDVWTNVAGEPASNPYHEI